MAGIIIGVTIICLLLVLMFLSSRRYVSLKRDFIVYWRSESASGLSKAYSLNLDKFRHGLLEIYDKKFEKILADLMSEKNFLNFDYISIRNKDGELLENYPSFSICNSGEVSIMINNADTYSVSYTKTINGVTLKLVFTKAQMTYELIQGGISISSSATVNTDKVKQ